MPSVDGIVSGMDTTALINAIVEASAGTKYVMQKQLDGYEDKQEKVAGIKNRLDSLVDTIKTMDGPTEFPSYGSTVSDETKMTAVTDSDVTPGTYSIEVSALAQSESEVSTGYADIDTTQVISTGTYQISYGSSTLSVAIDSTSNTLDGLAGKLDALDGLAAYVLDTGAASNPYKIVVMGEDTGASNSVDLSGLTGVSFTETVRAQDASLEVNGVAVSSDSNSLSDTIPGLDLSLLETTTSAVTVQVNRDEEAIVDKVQAFVDGFNEVINYYKTNTLYDTEKGIKGALIGDGTVRNIVEKLGSMVTAQYDLGLDFESLGQMGISTSQDGTIAFEASEFKDNMASNMDAVVGFFTDEAGPLATMRDRIEDVYLDTDDGNLKARSDSLEDTIADLEDSIIDFEERLDSYASRLRDQFNSMEVVLGDLFATQSYLSSLFAQGNSGNGK
jgi:flagellar hook-associated protein 2